MSDNITTQENYNNIQPENLNFLTKLSFGVGDFGTAISANIIIFYMSIFLTNVAGMNPAAAGTVRMIGGIWDAINDPIIGMLSDKTRSRWGRRYPWMIFAAVPLGIFLLLHWIVPPVSTNLLFWYYLIVTMVFNTLYTCVNLPYTALTPELTQDYNERTSLNSFRFTFSIGGSILSLLLAAIIFNTVKEPSQQYLIIGSICTIFCIIAPYLCVLGTRKKIFSNPKNLEVDNSHNMSYWEQMRIVFSNRPFIYVIGIYLFSWLGVQITATIIPYFVTDWMKMPASASATVALAVQGTALLMLFVWRIVSEKYGKKAVYFMGMSLWIIAQAGLFFLQPNQVQLLYILGVIAGFGVSTAYLVPWSMIPDVIDLDELKTGQRREGLFYGFMVLLQKIGLALGLFLVGIALEWAGFISKTGNQQVIQPDSALLAIRLSIGPLPTICLILGLVMAYLYPITREMHAEILLKLQEKKAANN